jgi:hypothetical protein
MRRFAINCLISRPIEILRNVRARPRAGRLRIAGRIVIAVQFGTGFYQIAQAPEVDRPKKFFEEAGAIAGGALGAEEGVSLGAKVGSIGGDAGIALGGLVGGLIGGIAGAATGHKLGTLIGQQYPPSQTQFEGDFQS